MHFVNQFARDAPGLQQHASHGRWGADRVGYLFFHGTPDSPCDSAPRCLVCLRNVRPRRHASVATTVTASRNKFSSAVPGSIGNLLSKYSNSCGIYFRLSTFQRELPLLHERGFIELPHHMLASHHSHQACSHVQHTLPISPPRTCLRWSTLDLGRYLVKETAESGDNCVRALKKV